MNRLEFGKVMTFIGVTCGNPMADRDRADAYFELLGDLSYDAFRDGAKVVMMTHKFPSFPSVAELREASVNASKGDIKELTAAEAWEMAEKVSRIIDVEVTGQFERRTKDLPEIVRRAMLMFGLEELCSNHRPNFGVMRAQFMRVFESIADKEKKTGMLPPAVRESIESHKRPEGVGILAGIGRGIS